MGKTLLAFLWSLIKGLFAGGPVDSTPVIQKEAEAKEAATERADAAEANTKGVLNHDENTQQTISASDALLASSLLNPPAED